MTGTVNDNSMVWTDKNDDNLTLKWDNLPWQKIKNLVCKLQKRIYKASLSSDFIKVKQLQKILLKSWFARCWAVKLVTQNYQRETLLDLNLFEVANSLLKSNHNLPQNLTQIYDQAGQMLIKIALVYQPKLSKNQAIKELKNSIKTQSYYFLKLKINNDFSEFNYPNFLAQIQTSSLIKNNLKTYLKTGLINKKVLTNIVFCGIENKLKSELNNNLNLLKVGSELIIFSSELKSLEIYQELITKIVKNLGIKVELKIEYRKVELSGFELKQYLSKNQLKVIVSPSKDSLKKHYQEIAHCIRKNSSVSQKELIVILNDKISNWANYYSSCVNNKGIFRKLDCLIWCKLKRWCKRRHPNQKAVKINGKSKPYWVHKYWQKIEQNHWVFADQDLTNILIKYSKRGNYLVNI